MRLLVRVLGFDLLDVQTIPDDEPDDKARDLSGGTLTATPVGFTSTERMSEDEGVDR